MTLFTVSLLVVPLILDGAMMVWSYYLPYQLITIYLAWCGLVHLKKNPNLFDEFNFMWIYKKILVCTIIFGIMIIIEDTVVIFSFDVYSDIMVKINNRSISEDILSIVYAVYALKFCYKVQNISVNQSLDTTDSNTSISLDSTEELFYDFSKFYNLTNREQEIFRLLLSDKTNLEISEELYISIGTVKTHIHNIFQKADVTRRNQLISKYRDFNSHIINT
ncbi:MAG: response regulator transcription factor [Peptostreptococcaceae bacterium]